MPLILVKVGRLDELSVYTLEGMICPQDLLLQDDCRRAVPVVRAFFDGFDGLDPRLGGLPDRVSRGVLLAQAGHRPLRQLLVRYELALRLLLLVRRRLFRGHLLLLLRLEQLVPVLHRPWLCFTFPIHAGVRVFAQIVEWIEVSISPIELAALLHAFDCYNILAFVRLSE